MDITSKSLERKTLSEECWVEVGGIGFRLDYPSRAQEIECRRLQATWQLGGGSGERSHWMEFYLRCVIKGVRNTTIDGVEARLEMSDNLASFLVADVQGSVKRLDIISTLMALGLTLSLVMLAKAKLDFNEVEKKTSA